MSFSSRSSTTSSSSSSQVGKYWEWIKELFEDESKLPDLALPITWEKIQKKHQQTAYDPRTHGMKDTTATEEKKSYHETKDDPVDFIHATAGHAQMPGTTKPASVRYQLYNDPQFQKSLVMDEDGSLLAPCLMHGDFVKVESLQADHFHAKKDIKARQKKLVEKLNNDKDFADCVMKLEGIDKFFKKTQMPDDDQEKIYGTLFFYELYFNDIDNLWLICQACNLQKKDKKEDFRAEWFQNHWMYGKQFLDYLYRNRADSTLIEKVQNGEGLAKVAIEWFWNHHAGYISRAQEFLKDVQTKIKILNKEIDHLVGSGHLEEANHLEMTFQFKLKLMKGVIQSDVISKKGVDEAAGHSTTKEEFSAITKEVEDSAEKNFKNIVRKVVHKTQEIERKRKATDEDLSDDDDHQKDKKQSKISASKK